MLFYLRIVHLLLQFGSVKYMSASDGMLLGVVVNVGGQQLLQSVLLSDTTQQNIEMTLMAEVVVVECRGC